MKNCANYGTTSHNGTTSGNLYIGGILGSSSSGTKNIENCVSGGKITSSKSGYIGSVVGQASSSTAIAHCYWTSDIGNYNACGSGSPSVDSETKQVTLNTATVDSLNSYNSSWNKWLLNINKKSFF